MLVQVAFRPNVWTYMDNAINARLTIELLHNSSFQIVDIRSLSDNILFYRG